MPSRLFVPPRGRDTRPLSLPLAAAAAAAAAVLSRLCYRNSGSRRGKGSELRPARLLQGKMKAGRKNLRRARDEGAAVTLAEGESIMQVLALRGSNVIEVMDGKGVKSLALFPAKFQKSFWIKNGSFVVVDASGRDEALESGSKIACVVSQVLFHDQVRALEKSDEWPAIFKSAPNEGSEEGKQGDTAAPSQIDEEPNSDEDDDLPPLEANTNRNRPYELYSDSESGSDS